MEKAEQLRSGDRQSGVNRKVSYEGERQSLDSQGLGGPKQGTAMRQEEGRCGETGSERGCWHGREMREQPGGEEPGGAQAGREAGRQPGALGRGEPQALVIRMALGRVGGMDGE